MAQFDDAVTAFRNGETMASVGLPADHIHAYRSGYLIGMTWGVGSVPLLTDKAAQYGPLSYHAGMVDGLNDAQIDRMADACIA